MPVPSYDPNPEHPESHGSGQVGVSPTQRQGLKSDILLPRTACFEGCQKTKHVPDRITGYVTRVFKRLFLGRSSQRRRTVTPISTPSARSDGAAFFWWPAEGQGRPPAAPRPGWTRTGVSTRPALPVPGLVRPLSRCRIDIRSANK